MQQPEGEGEGEGEGEEEEGELNIVDDIIIILWN